MTHDPNVYGYVNGKPVFSRDEFIYESRRRGPIEDDTELIAFAEKATSGWHSAGWSHMKHYGAVDDPKDITTKEYVDAADNALKVKVDALWDFVCTDITSNPFQITFDDLEGLTVRSGIWNTGQRRLEC